MFGLRGQIRFGTLAGDRIQNPFAQADGFRRDFKEFVSLNIRQPLFQREFARRNQVNRLVLAGSTNIGKLFGFGRVDFQIVGFGMFADYHADIYRNAGDTLCADGLTIAESAFMTTSKYDYTPDIMNEAFSTKAIYRIPLGGKIMVPPGESLLLCDIGMDHTVANSNSFDLTKADFEWYDVSSNPSFEDTDTEVPNLEKIYCYTATIWGPHNRGFTSFALARLGDDENNQLSKEDYLKDYAYTYEYNMIIGGNVYPMSGDAYKIPNKWILDAVNLSVESEYVWNVTSPALDRGWTYCGKVNQDKTRYGKSVRRKVLSGKTLQDTNDSSVDFLPEQPADPYYKFHE